MNKKKGLLMGAQFMLALTASILITIISGCTKSEPIKIGFVGGITGRVADLGIAGRDGVFLAVEEKNRNGGINGRHIEIIVKDDEQKPDIAIKVDRELIAAGVAVIIGHMTSSMSVAAIPIVNEHKVLMISPTTSTNLLTGLDDYFFRVYPYSAQTSKHLARYVYQKKGLRRTAVVYDTSNRAHTENAFIPFREEFETQGGAIVGVQTFLSGSDVSFMDIAKRIVAQKPDCLYILANAMDTAMLCQQLYKLGQKIQVISSDWSATDEIINFGGVSVEGLFHMRTIDSNSQETRYLKFKEAFYKRFGRYPDFAASHAYDCAQILIKALETNPDPSSLRDTIKGIEIFQSLQTEIRFDKYGDVIRRHYPIRIKDGRFVTEE